MLGLIGVVILTATAVVSSLIARSIVRPLRQLEDAAIGLAAGDLSERAGVHEGPREVQRLATTFDTMAARLEQLVGAQEAFIADASHQLRTPLQALRLRLENAEAEAPKKLRPDLEGALAEVARLGSLVEGLLALARAEKEPPSAEPVDVAGIIAERFDAWDAFAGERGVQLTTAATTAEAIATPGYLETVLDNLIANALDGSPVGASVEIGSRREDGWIEVHVTDHGKGMSAEQRGRATDRFWRADDAPHNGSGLGLAIAQRLLQLDGGELDLRDTPGGGLEAVVKLRRA
jgi:signal transduction histidine kinase